MKAFGGDCGKENFLEFDAEVYYCAHIKVELSKDKFSEMLKFAFYFGLEDVVFKMSLSFNKNIDLLDLTYIGCLRQQLIAITYHRQLMKFVKKI